MSPSPRDPRQRPTIPFAALIAAVVLVQVLIIGSFATFVFDAPL